MNEWAKRKGHEIKKVHKSKKLRKRIQKEIDKHNEKFGKWERIKDFAITENEWTSESGHLTPTMKMRRKIILEKHKDLYNKIYNL